MTRPPIATLMRRAFERHVLIPAFNICHLPTMRPVVETLERLDTFGMVEVARPDIEKFSSKSEEAVAAEYRRWANPDFVSLHLDHVPVIDEDGQHVDWKAMIERGLKNGYESVMIDGSRLPLDENIRITREVVAMSHPGVPVEAELGAVLGHEAGPLPPYEELYRTGRGFTDPGEARRFVRESGTDWLSVAIGSVHGAVSGAARDQKKVAARLNIEHLQKLVSVTGVPLVLHGGSSVKPEHVREAARHGIAKINIATDIRQPFEQALAAGKGEAAAQDAVAAMVEELITETYRIAGSRKILIG